MFNGRDGEWLTRAAAISRRETLLEVLGLERAQTRGQDLDLLVALVKRARLETIVEKAAELGARRVRLVITRRTQADHTNIARLAVIATEAAEQTGRLDVPEILPPARFAGAIAAWPKDRRLMFCDEAGDAAPVLEALAAKPAGRGRSSSDRRAGSAPRSGRRCAPCHRRWRSRSARASCAPTRRPSRRSACGRRRSETGGGLELYGRGAHLPWTAAAGTKPFLGDAHG